MGVNGVDLGQKAVSTPEAFFYEFRGEDPGKSAENKMSWLFDHGKVSYSIPDTLHSLLIIFHPFSNCCNVCLTITVSSKIAFV